MLRSLSYLHLVYRRGWSVGVERFNRTIQEAIFRDEDFLINLVEDKQEANHTIESYLDFYNNERPHMSLRFMTPAEFLLQYTQRNSAVQNVVS